MSIRVILADDHPMIRQGLQQILLKEFPTAYIVEVSDAEGVIKESMSGDWDLVITDLNMPGRGGLEVAEYIRANFPKLPVLILSMQPEEHVAVRALKAGAWGYLSKEIEASEFIVAVHKV